MVIERIEILSKKLHEFAEMFDASCKAGDGFEAAVIIGRLTQTIPELKAVAKAAQGSNQPYNNAIARDQLQPVELGCVEPERALVNEVEAAGPLARE